MRILLMLLILAVFVPTVDAKKPVVPPPYVPTKVDYMFADEVCVCMAAFQYAHFMSGKKAPSPEWDSLNEWMSASREIAEFLTSPAHVDANRKRAAGEFFQAGRADSFGLAARLQGMADICRITFNDPFARISYYEAMAKK